MRLTGEVDAHWRGAYDILVQPRGGDLGLGKTAGLVEPNFVALAGHGGISVDQLSAIRAIDGVEIAAPVGWVGLVTTLSASPSIEVTKFPDRPTVYEVRLTISTSDGLADRTLYTNDFRTLLGQTQTTVAPTAYSDYGDAVVGPLPAGGFIADLGTGRSVPAPQIQSPVLALDPEAERALLGDAGAFLDPMIRLPHRDTLTASTIDPKIVLRDFDAGLNIDILRSQGSPMSDRPVFPALVSTNVYATLKVSVEVTQIGHPIDAAPESSNARAALDLAVAAAGSGRTKIGTNTTNATNLIRPLRLNGIGGTWPGSAQQPGGFFVQPVPGSATFSAGLTGRPSYAALPGRVGSSSRVAVRVTPLLPNPGRGSASLGTFQQRYRVLETVDEPIAKGFEAHGRLDAPFVIAPIATYDLNKLHLPRDPLSYVPYGAYEPPVTTLVASSNGAALTPTAMRPMLDPAGLIGVPPMAIVDIGAAKRLRGAAPIDVVRVRVDGLSGFDPAAAAKVERVADAIARLGLDVRIVAGSSPQPVDIYVPSYTAGSDALQDLGWVEQEWTSLGAAQRVESSLDDTNSVLLVLAIAALAVVVLTREVLGGAVRSRDARILAAVGWSRGAVLRWQLGVPVVSASLCVLAGGVLFVATGGQLLAFLTLVLAALFLLVGGVIGAVLSGGGAGIIRSDIRFGPLARLGHIKTLWGYGFRTVALRPQRALAVILGIALSAAELSIAGGVLVAIAIKVGPTNLAAALSARLLPYQVALLVLATSITLTFALLTLRADLVSRRVELRVLTAAGWTRGEIRRMLGLARMFVAVPAALGAGLLAAATAPAVAGPGSPVVLLSGVAAAIAILGLMVCGRTAERGIV